jgi:hypothetical protein
MAEETPEESIKRSQKEQESYDNLIAKQKELNNLMQNESEILKNVSEAEDLRIKQQRDLLNTKNQIRDLEEMLLKRQGEYRKEAQQELKDAKEKLEEQEKFAAGTDKQIKKEKAKLKEIKKYSKELDKVNKKIKKTKKDQDDFLDGFKNLGGGIGNVFKGISGMMDKVKKLEKFGQFLSNFGKSMSKIPGLSKLAGPMTSLGGAIGRVGSALGALSTVALAAVAAVAFLLYEVVMLTNKIDELSKKLSRNVGVGNVFQQQMFSTYRNAVATGASLDEVSEALGSVANNVSAFNQNNKQLNVSLATTITKLSRVGVDANTSSKRIDFFNRALGMTLERSADVTVEIALMGQTIGRTTKQMMNDFEQFSKRFVLFGGTAMRTFKEMSAMAKATGIEVSKLVSVSEKFDTFESAADHVSKLNSILGTNLSTVQMLNIDDAKRIDIIRRQVRASVGQFSSLNKYQKLYIAQAMGINDVDEAQRLLNMSTAEYNKYLRGQNEQSATKNLDAFSKSLNTLGEEFAIIGRQILVGLEPVFYEFNLILQESMPYLQALGKILRVTLSNAFIMFSYSMGATRVTLQHMAKGVKFVNSVLDDLVTALQGVYDMMHLPGSPELWELPAHSAKGYESMANSMGAASAAAMATSGAMKGVHDSMHKAGGKSFSIEAMAKLDTSKIASGFQQIKSALVDISSVQVDGFLALKTDGASTSMVMGSDGLIKNMTEGKLTVDVKMPEMKMPDVHVKVYIGDLELREIIRQESKTNWVEV